MQTHEPISSFRKIALGSERKFGFTFAAVFFVLGIWPWLHAGASPRWALLILCAALVTIAAIAPKQLAPLNRAWFKLGLALSRIANPIVMGILFFGAVVPFGLYVRWRNKDLLHLAIDRDGATYWIERHPPGPAPGTLTKQF